MNIPILDAAAVEAWAGRIDFARVLRDMFGSLHAGRSAQPPQSLTLFPDGSGDFITYQGVMPDAGVFGAKLSPYIVRPGDLPLITAWTLLMSTTTGRPLLLCDAARLTTERTAGVTALAVDLLAPAGARRLAIVGAGALAEAHLRHVLPLRNWESVMIASRRLGAAPAGALERFTARDGRVEMRGSVDEAVAGAGADVILLCTSSAGPVVDPERLERPALICSISTNVPRAHEIPPAALPGLDVYCDYRAAAPLAAGEMLIAREAHGWSPDSIVADLGELVGGKVIDRDGLRHAFFRSIGLGLEDIAVAAEIHRALSANL